MNRTTHTLMVASLLAATGCYEGIPGFADTDAAASSAAAGTGNGPDGSPSGGDGDGTGGEDDGAGESGAPSPEGEGPAELPLGRAIRRMSADQFMRSLEVATGQRWDDFEEYSAAMGKADFAEITEHDRTLSVTFEKFINDAAFATCTDAVDLDADDGGTVILRHATLQDDDEAAVRTNVQYLLLRFLADETDLDDAAIDPWADLVRAPIEDSDAATETRRTRWTAVCVGLATHVDFITY